jgi:hypothetical protein
MIRTTTAACLLLSCGLASAQQSGSITISNGPGSVSFIPAPDFNAGDFQNIHIESSAQIHFVTSPAGLFGAVMRQPEPVGPLLRPEAALEQVLVTEGEGVRMPDEQFTLPAK